MRRFFRSEAAMLCLALLTSFLTGVASHCYFLWVNPAALWALAALWLAGWLAFFRADVLWGVRKHWTYTPLVVLLMALLLLFWGGFLLDQWAQTANYNLGQYLAWLPIVLALAPMEALSLVLPDGPAVGAIYPYTGLLFFRILVNILIWLYRRLKYRPPSKP